MTKPVVLNDLHDNTLILHQTSLKKVTFLGSEQTEAYYIWQLCVKSKIGYQ